MERQTELAIVRRAHHTPIGISAFSDSSRLALTGTFRASW
jgi:hypothetical protein